MYIVDKDIHKNLSKDLYDLKIFVNREEIKNFKILNITIQNSTLYELYEEGYENLKQYLSSILYNLTGLMDKAIKRNISYSSFLEMDESNNLLHNIYDIKRILQRVFEIAYIIDTTEYKNFKLKEILEEDLNIKCNNLYELLNILVKSGYWFLEKYKE